MTSHQASPSTPPASAATGDTGDQPRQCAECGTLTTPGQSFCDGCGAVLSWTPGRGRGAAADTPGTPGSDPGRPATSADAEADAGSTVPAREPARADAPTAEPEEEDDTLTSIPVISVTQPVPQAAPAAGTSDPDASERARALLVPVADQRAADPAPEVAPVLPGMPAAARPRVQAPIGEPAYETGPPCPWCEVGNRPDRHFCRRCGMSLAERPGVPEARRPRWRRMRDFGDRPTPWAGERPRLRRGIGRIFTWVAYGLALGLVIYGAFHVDTAWNATRDHFAKRAQISPDAADASRSFKGHPPKAIFDKINNSWWGPGVSQSAEGEWVEARFQEPTRLLDILITSGISTKPSDLSEAALPHRMDAVITTADGKKSTRHIKLDQMSGPQQRKFRAQNVVSVRFIIRSAFNVGADKQVSIAEIEFFTRATTSGT